MYSGIVLIAVSGLSGRRSELQLQVGRAQRGSAWESVLQAACQAGFGEGERSRLCGHAVSGRPGPCSHMLTAKVSHLRKTPAAS